MTCIKPVYKRWLHGKAFELALVGWMRVCMVLDGAKDIGEVGIYIHEPFVLDSTLELDDAERS